MKKKKILITDNQKIYNLVCKFESVIFESFLQEKALISSDREVIKRVFSFFFVFFYSFIVDLCIKLI